MSACTVCAILGTPLYYCPIPSHARTHTHSSRELTGDEDDLLEDSGSEGMEVETPVGTNPKKLEEAAFMTEEQARISKWAMVSPAS